MLNGLGLSSYFGEQLTECIAKNLDNYNYCSSRLNSLLSKLQGAVAGKALGREKPAIDDPEIQAIKSKLQEDEDKEATRKQLRKEKENAKLEQQAKPTPDIEIEDDLASPPPQKSDVV